MWIIKPGRRSSTRRYREAPEEKNFHTHTRTDIGAKIISISKDRQRSATHTSTLFSFSRTARHGTAKQSTAQQQCQPGLSQTTNTQPIHLPIYHKNASRHRKSESKHLRKSTGIRLTESDRTELIRCVISCWFGQTISKTPLHSTPSSTTSPLHHHPCNQRRC